MILSRFCDLENNVMTEKMLLLSMYVMTIMEMNKATAITYFRNISHDISRIK